MQDMTLLECRAQRSVQAVFEVELALPFDDVGEQVTEVRGFLGEQVAEIELALGRISSSTAPAWARSDPSRAGSPHGRDRACCPLPP